MTAVGCHFHCDASLGSNNKEHTHIYRYFIIFTIHHCQTLVENIYLCILTKHTRSYIRTQNSVPPISFSWQARQSRFLAFGGAQNHRMLHDARLATTEMTYERTYTVYGQQVATSHFSTSQITKLTITRPKKKDI